MRSAFHAVVHGEVQGVGFRYHTRRAARDLGLGGSVRNLPDGTVEVIAEGPREALERLAAWLRVGPATARVDRVDLSWREPRGLEPPFDVSF